jgi:hypothetical protein
MWKAGNVENGRTWTKGIEQPRDRGGDRGAHVEHRLDFLVEKVLLVEMKAVSALKDIFFVIARALMRAAGIRDGIVLNFATLPLTIKRVGPGLASVSSVPAFHI